MDNKMVPVRTLS